MDDPLEKMALTVDFEVFRPLLETAFPKRLAGQGGRPPYDAVLMFKILLLQQWYGLADDRTEYVIKAPRHLVWN